MRVWTEAVKRAILRHVAHTGNSVFTRQAFFAAEEAALRVETDTTGITPRQTGTREFQVLRDMGLLEFVDRGTYRWLGDMPAPEPQSPSSAVFALSARSERSILPEAGFVFPAEWLRVARRTAGQWILYQGAGGYGAAARVANIATTPGRWDRACAEIEQGSYIEFGRVVPLEVDGRAVEEALIGADGRLDGESSAHAVRAIGRDAFNRVLELALVSDDDLLPRDAVDDAPTASVKEERSAWDGPVDRMRMLVERSVRDRQFRKRVLDAYGGRCALTGMKLTNGRGRAETQAAHIKSVEAGGPDSLTNGIALSGTMHWMFDRGLVSLSDAGDILLSRAINDRESVERLVYPDRKARLPAGAAHRPNPEYLEWHRTVCFHH